jgi:hypothetical protein
MESQTLEIPFAQVQNLLEMINMCNKEIKMALSFGKSETSLMVRQSKYQRDRYLRELNTLLIEHGINLQELTTKD